MSKIERVLIIMAMDAEAAPIIETLGLVKDDPKQCAFHVSLDLYPEFLYSKPTCDH